MVRDEASAGEFAARLVERSIRHRKLDFSYGLHF